MFFTIFTCFVIAKFLDRSAVWRCVTLTWLSKMFRPASWSSGVAVFHHFQSFCLNQILGQICYVEVCNIDMAV